MNRRRGRGRVAPAATAAVCAVAALQMQAWAAGEPSPYTFDSDARPVQGTPVNSNGPELTAGSAYKDSIRPGEKRYYRIDLDAKSNAYVSAVAVPRPGTKVSYADHLEVSIEDSSGTECSDGRAGFGSATYVRPVADYASRRIEKNGSSCQEAGTYYVLLVRTGEDTSTPQPWGVELRFASEPGLKATAPTTAPESWPSASPAAPDGGPRKRHGGTSFHDSTSLEQGEWQDRIQPGETLFYRVPVDWGQQIFAAADLANSPAEKTDSVANALVLALHNPARGFVDDEASMFYDGKQKSVSLDPLPPVAYENRYDSDAAISAMRFAGWYYLSVTLSPQIAQAYGENAIPLTLRVNIEGKGEQGPAYAGAADDFQVTDEDRAAADSGKNAEETATSGTMAVVAAAGIGTGTVLVAGLGVWTVLARRRTPVEGGQAAFAMPGQAGPRDPTRGYGQTPAQGHGQGFAQGYGQGPAQGPGSGRYGPPPGQ